MRIEQGIPIYSIDDFLNDNDCYPLDEIYISESIMWKGCYFIAKNMKNIATEPLSLDTAIKIAKMLNEDLKRGDV